MRWGFGNLGLAGLALGLATSCSGSSRGDLSGKLGCGQIDGLGAISGERPPAYILVGETIETMEGPGAFAELACRLAALQPKDKPLWVGVPDYIGGSTEAVRAMRQRLGDLVGKGAPIVVGQAGKGQTVGASRREDAERIWAKTIMASVDAAGAGRALLLLPRRDGVVMRVIADDRRLEDYTPMALFLPEGQVMNFEIRQTNGVDAPAIRVYLKMTGGYVGLFALASLTPAEKTAPGAKAE